MEFFKEPPSSPITMLCRDKPLAYVKQHCTGGGRGGSLASNTNTFESSTLRNEIIIARK